MITDNRIIKLLTLAVALVITTAVVAQVPVEISKQKIVSEGKVYYMHKVIKGQTLYSVSRAYNVTVEAITGANTIPPNGIQEGQLLKIPAEAGRVEAKAKSETPPPASSQPPSVSASHSQPQSQPQPQSEVYHRVLKGETLSSVSRMYGISVHELRKANKGLLFPKEGDYLLIPPRKRGEEAKAQRANDTLATKDVSEEMTDSLFKAEEADSVFHTLETTVIDRLEGSMKVAVMLPFFLSENSKRSYIDSTRRDSRGNTIYKEVFLPGEWVYEGSLPFIEMYEGILVAVDSLRALGLTVELSVFDTDADTVKTDRLITAGGLRDMDLIIGPVFSYNLRRVAEYAGEHNIPVVSPVPLRDQTILEDRPTLFRMYPTVNVFQEIIVREADMHRNSNIVFVYADSMMFDPQTAAFWERLTSTIRPDSITDTTLVTPFYFAGVTPRRDTYRGVLDLESVMKPDRENVLILAITQTAKVSTALAAIHTLSRKYPIRVMGYPELGKLETIDLKYYYDLQMLFPSETYIDFSKRSTNAFLRSYYKLFQTEPTVESFSWRGFDIAYYFIGGLAWEGRSFLRNPGKFNPELLCHDPVFVSEGRNSGFENRGIYTLQYNKDMSVSVSPPRYEKKKKVIF